MQFIVHSSVTQANNYEQYKDFAIKNNMTQYYVGNGHTKHRSHQTNFQIGKQGAEAAVRNSGIKYTILRPGFFDSNYLASKAGFQAPGLVKYVILWRNRRY